MLILLFKVVYRKSLVRLQVTRFVWLVYHFKLSFLTFNFYGISTVVMLRKIFGLIGGSSRRLENTVLLEASVFVYLTI